MVGLKKRGGTPLGVFSQVIGSNIKIYHERGRGLPSKKETPKKKPFFVHLSPRENHKGRQKHNKKRKGHTGARTRRAIIHLGKKEITLPASDDWLGREVTIHPYLKKKGKNRRKKGEKGCRNSWECVAGRTAWTPP